jgi:hypothetical protein
MWDFALSGGNFAEWEREATSRILHSSAAASLGIVTLDSNDLSVPLVKSFFRRNPTPRECSICSQDLYEIAFKDVDAWKEACRGFEGPWMWEVLEFPTVDTLKCDHELDFCRSCVTEYLDAELTRLGPTGCHRLSCPGCDRQLSEAEVRSYGSKEVLERQVDRFHVECLGCCLFIFWKKGIKLITELAMTTSCSFLRYRTSLISAGASEVTFALTDKYTRMSNTWIRKSHAKPAVSRCALYTRKSGTTDLRVKSTMRERGQTRKTKS